VKENIKETGDVWLHTYPGKTTVIHTVGPNFKNEHKHYKKGKAITLLASIYLGIFFTYLNYINRNISIDNELRLLPVSSGLFAGGFNKEMPEITVKAINKAYSSLPENDKSIILDKTKLCIYDGDTKYYDTIWR